MKQVRGFWLPDSEHHLVDFLMKGPMVFGGPTYQYHKLKPAVGLVPREKRKVAVDVGGHCGLWSRVLQHEFERVEAFEPVQAHRDCFKLNVKGKNVTLWDCALGEKDGVAISLHTGPSSSGDTYVQKGGEHNAVMRTIDSFNMSGMDFLKIDCEGYEYYVLKGAEATVKKYHPVVIVEQKPKKGSSFGLKDTAAVDLLKEWGAKLKFEYAGDYCMAWE